MSLRPLCNTLVTLMPCTAAPSGSQTFWAQKCCIKEALCPTAPLGAQAVTLRRVKSDQYNGRPIVVLPPLEVSVESLLFSEEEENIYLAFEAKMQVRPTPDLYLLYPASLDAVSSVHLEWGQ